MALPVAVSCQGQPGTDSLRAQRYWVPPHAAKALMEIADTTSCPERSLWLPSCTRPKQSQGQQCISVPEADVNVLEPSF